MLGFSKSWRIEDVAYKLAWPLKLSKVHNVFHVFLVKKFVPDPKNMIEYKPLQVHEDLTYQEFSIRIIDQKV